MAVRPLSSGLAPAASRFAWSTALYRFRQGLGALRPRIPADRDIILSKNLSGAQREAFLTLSAHDQAHSCRVFRLLEQEGAPPAVLVAGLLHDIGKSGPDGRVRLAHRVARVVLRRLAPGLLARLARLPAGPGRVGIARAVHHPRLGAERARALGCDERVCWLIAHHEDAPAPDDPELGWLIAADHAAG